MSTTQQTPSKRPPGSARKQHNHNARAAASDNDNYTTDPNEQFTPSKENKHRQRRKSHANKRGNSHANSNAVPDAGVYSDGAATRSTSQIERTRATPMKQQAYAGPTFHQSPAASALPLPSFYSKSLPSAPPIKPHVIDETDNSTGSNANNTPTQGAAPAQTRTQIPEIQRESTPLDFLFEAARKAKAAPGGESPRMYLSSAADTPASQSPAPREGDAVFPFELDSADRTHGEDGSAFSTPYKERIDALRSAQSPQHNKQSLDEAERRAKSAALKNFLMSSAQSPDKPIDNNPFNARPMPSHHEGGFYQQQTRHRSNPTTPLNYQQYNPQNSQYFPPMPPVSTGTNHLSPNHKQPTSGLRHVYEPGSATVPAELPVNNSNQTPRISTARGSHNLAYPQYNNINHAADPGKSKVEQQNPGHRATPSAQQLEDDLRRVLKLDLIGRS